MNWFSGQISHLSTIALCLLAGENRRACIPTAQFGLIVWEVRSEDQQYREKTMSASKESDRHSTLRRQGAGQGSSQQPPTPSTSSQGTKHFTPSPAMLRTKNKIQEKFRNPNSTSKGKGKSRRSEAKGKNYSSQAERKVVDRRDPKKVVQRNKECDTKKGGRNSKTGYYFRNFRRLGSNVKTGRPDRVYNADCSGEPYSQFVAENKQ